MSVRVTNGVPPRAAREWRVVMGAEIVSVIGDQLSRVGLSLIVFDRTGSTALTGLTYALTLLPDLMAGPLLAPVADRFPRRDVMVTCALLQALLVTVMLLPGVPFAVLAAAVAGVAVCQAPAKAAQNPLLREILGDAQIVGQGRVTIIQQAGQLASLAGAATLVATIGPVAALAADAASFAVVGVLLRLGVQHRPAPRPNRHPAENPQPTGADKVYRLTGRSVLRDEPRVRALTIYVASVSGSVAPAAVIAPLLGELAAPAWAAGPLLAADCAGMIIATHLLCAHPGAWPSGPTGALRRAVRILRTNAARERAIPILGVLCAAPLVLFAVRPPITVAAALLLAVGIGSAIIPLARADMIDYVPDHVAGAVSGLVRTWLRGGQGIIAAATGGLAALTGPGLAVATAGGICTAGATTAVLIWRRQVVTASAARVARGLS